TRAPVAVIVPHLFGTAAFQEANAIVASYVVLLEGLIPSAYRGSRYVVISESTRDDLVRRGVPRASIAVVHCGLDHARYRVDPAVPKAARPTLLFGGRLRRYKGVDWLRRVRHRGRGGRQPRPARFRAPRRDRAAGALRRRRGAGGRARARAHRRAAADAARRGGRPLGGALPVGRLRAALARCAAGERQR